MADISSLFAAFQYLREEDLPFNTPMWWACVAVSAGLVLFAGIMSGLTLGLMSLGLMDLEVIKRSGSDSEQKQAAAILPVVTKQHQLLVTLLLCNSAAMEALPLFLDRLVHPVVAVILSVTLVLIFGEVLPQAACSRYGLAIGAKLIWLVKLMMAVCWVVAYPVGKVLDWMLGHNESGVFRRSQLKALVEIHGEEAGELSKDETTIIGGVLDLTAKSAALAMTPIESTFSLDVNSRLDWDAMGQIMARGHSRVPIYAGNPKNIIGIVLVKNLLTIRPEDERPISSISIRRIPRIAAETSLYDLLNEFQKGGSHMAAVVQKPPEEITEGDAEAKPTHAHGSPRDEGKHLVHSLYSESIHAEKEQKAARAAAIEHSVESMMETHKKHAAPAGSSISPESKAGSSASDSIVVLEIEDEAKSQWKAEWEGGGAAAGEAANGGSKPQASQQPSTKRTEGGLGKHKWQHPERLYSVGSCEFEAEAPGEVIGIITLEDVIEELLQEEIVDETDEYIDVAKRTRVAGSSEYKRINSFRHDGGNTKVEYRRNPIERRISRTTDKVTALTARLKSSPTDPNNRLPASQVPDLKTPLLAAEGPKSL